MKKNYSLREGLILLALAMGFAWSAMKIQAEEPGQSTSAPVFNSFALDANNLGAISSSVNLYSGDVNLPLTLFSLPGRGGLDVSISISYSSNVQQVVGTWNLEAPTGILGLGWSMDYEKIVVDHKNTGSRHDDDFYLVGGGASNLLVRTGTSGGNYLYETKNYQFWKITFYPSDERWEIIREDGTIYEYGDENSTRNTVQWGIKWENWIGSSSEATGPHLQEQFALVWNLSKIKNIWDDEITFNYLNPDEKVGSGSLKHTEASYLQEIIDVFGRKVVFTYDLKYGADNPDPGGKIEYEEPHIEDPTEPDAYQERYEKQFLDYIEVFDDNNKKLFSEHFGYGFLDSGNLTKRLLTSITHKNASNDSLPSLKFDYKTASPNKGALEKITYPQGGTATYTYTELTIGRSDREKSISNSGLPSGFAEPKVYIAQDYVVVTWYNDVSDKLRVFVYKWDGEWVETYLEEISDINEVSGLQNYGILLEEGFFALLTRFRDDYPFKDLHIYHKLNSKRDGWHSYLDDGIDMQAFSLAQMTSGNDFVAVVSREEGALFSYKWNGTDWDDSVEYNPGSDTRISGTNNYFVRHKIPGNDVIDIYYLDELHAWTTATIPWAITFDSDDANWFSGNSFSLVFAEDDPEYIYRWDEDFLNFYRDTVINPGIDDGSAAFIFDANISITEIDDALGFRWTGKEWKKQIFTSVTGYTSSAQGNDFIVRRDKRSTGYIRRWVFDPNTLLWTNTQTNVDSPDPVSVSSSAYAWATDSGTPAAKIFSRNSSGWSESSVSPWGADDFNLQVGSQFYVYEDHQGASIIGTRIGFYDNGVWGSNAPLDGNAFTGKLVVGNTAVTHNGGSLSSSTSLNLYRFVNDAVEGQQKDYPVEKLQVNDGYSDTYTFYKYTSSTATYEPSGAVAQYNEVEVIPASSDGIAKPSGFTKHYFFNGLPYNEASLAYPANDTYTNARDYYNLLKGTSYATKVYDQSGSEISSSTNYWKVFTKVLGSKDEGTYARVMQTKNTTDGVETVRTMTIHTLNGLVSGLTENHPSGGIRTAETTFAFDVPHYSSMKTKNMLSQVAQQSVYQVSLPPQYKSSAATTWKDWGSGKWASIKTYVWREDDPGSGTTLPQFDFVNWSDQTEPTESEWIKTSKVLSRDSFGNIKEIEDGEENVTTTKWGYNSAVSMATISNATNVETFVDDFDDGDFDDGIPLDWYTTGSYWSITNGNLHWTSSSTSSGMCSNPNSLDQNNFIADFDIRVVDGYTSDDWAAFNFRKNNHTDTPFQSGYIVYLRENGRVDFYNPTDGMIGSYQSAGSAADWHNIRVIAKGSNMKVILDGELIMDITNSTYNGSYSGFYSYRAESQFDNIRLYPDDAICTSQSYDPQMFFVTKQIDENGIATALQYDEFNRPIRTINADGMILTEQSRYLSRAGNGDSFSASDPNSATSASYPDGLPTDGLVGYWRLDGHAKDASGKGNDGTINGATDDPGFIGRGMEFDGNDDYVEISNDASLKTLPGVTVAAWVYPDNGVVTNDIILNKENEYEIGWKWNGQLISAIRTDTQSWFFTSGTGTNTLPIGEWTHVAATWDGSFIREYIDGELKRTTSQSGNTTYDGGESLRIGKRFCCGEDHWTGKIDEVLIYNRALSDSEIKAIATPLIATTYADGLGRQIQAHTRNGDNDIIAQSSYNTIGKAEKQYQPQDLSNPLHTYKTSLTGSYELFEYFDDPLARLEKQTHSDATAINYDFGSESFNGQTYRYQEIQDETGRVTRTYSDGYGNNVGGRDAIGTGDETKWVNEYDIVDNLITIKPPNYFNPPTGTSAADWQSDLVYNTLGQLVEQTTPDAGTTKFVYDLNGNLRYLQNAAQAPGSDFTATHYDEHGRATIIGEEKDFNWTTTPPSIDNTTYGTDPDEWKIKNDYDEIFVTGVDNFGQGALTKVEVNDDVDDTAEHTTLFVYDKFGNLLEKHITIDSGSPITEKIISHTYDLLGREIQLTYPSGNIVLREFDNVGRLKKIVHQ